MLIDTMGLGDSEGRDTKHLAEMVLGMTKIVYVHCFLIVVNSQDLRISQFL